MSAVEDFKHHVPMVELLKLIKATDLPTRMALATGVVCWGIFIFADDPAPVGAVMAHIKEGYKGPLFFVAAVCTVLVAHDIGKPCLMRLIQIRQERKALEESLRSLTDNEKIVLKKFILADTRALYPEALEEIIIPLCNRGLLKHVMTRNQGPVVGYEQGYELAPRAFEYLKRNRRLLLTKADAALIDEAMQQEGRDPRK